MTSDKLPLYVLPVPDAKSLNIDALNILLEGLNCYAFCPVPLIPKSHCTSEHQVQNDCSGPTVAHDALVLGSGESINQTSITATSLVSETAIRSEIPSESVALVPSCLAP